MAASSKKLAKSSAIISLLLLLNVFLLYVIQVLLAKLFGAGAEMDSYFAATTIPTLIKTVFISAINIAFIPVFIECLVGKEEREAWLLAGSFMNLILVILSLMALTGIILAPQIVRIVFPGFKIGAEQFSLTVGLLRILLLTIIFSGATALLAGIHYSFNRFALPFIAPVINSICIIGFTVLFSGRMGVWSVALGALVGSIVQFGVLCPILLRSGRYSLTICYKNAALVKIITLMAPWAAAAMVYKANTIVDRFIASGLPTGSITYLGYAYLIIQTTAAAATQGISTVLFPLMAKRVASGSIEELKVVISLAVRMILFIILPIITILVILRNPIIQILFQRGEFTANDTVSVGSALACYSGALFAMSVGNVIAYVYYACQDTKIPAIVGVGGMIIHVVLALELTRSLSYLGPAISFSVMAMLNLTLLILLLRKKLSGIRLGEIGRSFAKIFMCSVAMGITLLVVHNFVVLLPFAHSMSDLIVVGSSLVLGLIVYLVAAHILGVKEMDRLTSLIRTWLLGKKEMPSAIEF